MKIEVKLLTQFKRYLPRPDLSGNNRTIEVKENATIEDVIKTLGIPIDTPKVIMQNDKQATLSDRLKEGDRVTVFPPVGGG
ncbi:MAG: MoaD/ThiS family protein [Deltaproteobacteria bacterium]|nr:MoaD/ThiS family protein [Deltaproteobacteria bacterium]MBW1963210.1 MoaD/ThiS family protein [Deltaproteobacteria bacterium]MBW2154733.1 MoaD/ThiS family protein [Deltaproteobacteria bacterium]